MVYRADGTEWGHTGCIYMGLVPFMAMVRAGGIVDFDLILLDGDYWDEGFRGVKNYWLSHDAGGRILVYVCGDRGLDILGVDAGLQDGYRAWFSEVCDDVYGFLFDFVSSVI